MKEEQHRELNRFGCQFDLKLDEEKRQKAIRDIIESLVTIIFALATIWIGYYFGRLF